jgi:hypothetical protein
MECSRPKQQILGEIIAWFVIFRHLAEICKKSTFCVRFPEVYDAINSKWPFFGQLGR